MSVRVLHLSDLGWPADGLRIRSQADALVRAASNLAPDLVAVTGDLVDQGTAAEFAGVEVFLRELLAAVKLDPTRLLLVAGERDVDRAALGGSARFIHQGLLADGPQEVDTLLADPDERRVLLRRLDRWRALADRLGCPATPLEVPWWHHTLTVRGTAVGLAGLCTAWAATADADEPGLLLGQWQVAKMLDPLRDCELRIALVHHDLTRLARHQEDAARALRTGVHLLLRGHDREPNWDLTPPAHEAIELVAGHAFSEPGRFALVELSHEAVQVRPFVWHKAHNAYVPDRNGTNKEGLVTLPRATRPRQDPPPPPRAPLLTLRHPDPPVEPGEPWPLLAPIEHSAHLGGRDVELRELAGVLAQDRAIVTVFATSGAGKSSLLRAGLLPHLRSQGVPVAIDHLPAVRHLARRLLEQLVLSPPQLNEGDAEGFAAALAAVRDIAGKRPVIVLDQFEEVFLQPAALALLGPLLAATEVATGGRACRWVLAYRHEFHGRVRSLLADPLRYAALPPDRAAALPTRLDAPQVAAEWPLRPLGDPRGVVDRTGHVARCFVDAILRPLRAGRYGWTLHAADALRLAEGFARARAGHEDAPLTPELQVVLRRLQDEADGGQLVVPQTPDAVDALLDQAITAHVGRLLDRVTAGEPEGHAARRTDALLILAGLIDEAGRRQPVLLTTVNERLREEGRRLLHALQDSGVWLVRIEVRDGLQYATLPHDRVANAVRELTTDPAQAIRYGLDPEVVDLWRFASARALAFQGGDKGAALVEPERMAALIARADALPWSGAMEGWWKVAQAEHRARLRRELVATVRAAAVQSGEPLRALHRLRVELALDGAALAEVIACGRGADAFDQDRRDAVFGEGPAGLSEAERAELLPPLVVALAGHVEGSEAPEALYGALLAALDTVRPAPEGATAAVVAAMRAARGEPPVIDPEDGTWSPVVEGEFRIGRFPGEGMPGQDDEVLREVVLSPYRMRRFAETLQEYQSFAPHHLADKWGWGKWPALQVSWYEACAYAAWVGAALPTEAQWEVAARGGGEGYTTGLCYAGNSEADLDRCSVLGSNRDRVVGAAKPMAARTPIAGAPAHPLGLLHVHGNVWEWTEDWYAACPPTDVLDPRGPITAPPPHSAGRVVRGGSWMSSAVYARSAYRRGNRPGSRVSNLGFRLALPEPVSRGT